MSIFNAEQRADWDRDGYVMVRRLFDAEEIAILRSAIEGDPALRDSLRPTPLDRAALLQRGAQQPDHRTPPPDVHAARQGGRRCDQARGREVREFEGRVPRALGEPAGIDATHRR